LVLQIRAINKDGEVKGPAHLDEISVDFDPIDGGTEDDKKKIPIKNPKITPKP
jgi:hypothetical protein